MFNLIHLALKPAPNCTIHRWSFASMNTIHLNSCFQLKFLLALQLTNPLTFLYKGLTMHISQLRREESEMAHSLDTLIISAGKNNVFNSFIPLAWMGKLVARFTCSRWHFTCPGQAGNPNFFSHTDSLSFCTSDPQTCGSCSSWHNWNDNSVSAHKRQSCHDAEAQQDEDHLEKLLPGGVELMWEDL